MVVVRKCTFCGGGVKPGTGIMFVRNDGSIHFFCSSKCDRNARLGRKPHKIRWTKRYRNLKGKT
jgi:large subunit ribosomal protein L24e